MIMKNSRSPLILRFKAPSVGGNAQAQPEKTEKNSKSNTIARSTRSLEETENSRKINK